MFNSHEADCKTLYFTLGKYLPLLLSIGTIIFKPSAETCRLIADFLILNNLLINNRIMVPKKRRRRGRRLTFVYI